MHRVMYAFYISQKNIGLEGFPNEQKITSHLHVTPQMKLDLNQPQQLDHAKDRLHTIPMGTGQVWDNTCNVIINTCSKYIIME